MNFLKNNWGIILVVVFMLAMSWAIAYHSGRDSVETVEAACDSIQVCSQDSAVLCLQDSTVTICQDTIKTEVVEVE